MNDVHRDVYREVSHWRRLLPRERDVVTGRLAGGRDDKGRRQDDGQRAPRPPGRTLAAAGVVAAVVVTGGVLGARAVVSDDEEPRPSASSPSAAAPASVPTDAPATAISLEYVGGALVRHECTDATGGGECVYFDDDYTPLTVRCTSDGCNVDFYGSGSIDGPLRLTGKVAPFDTRCQPTTWTIDLTPVGDAVTEGIRHPARIIGTVTKSRPAEDLPAVNCLGAVDEYHYDALPS